jgi:hypothetical protein
MDKQTNEHTIAQIAAIAQIYNYRMAIAQIDEYVWQVVFKLG